MGIGGRRVRGHGCLAVRVIFRRHLRVKGRGGGDGGGRHVTRRAPRLVFPLVVGPDALDSTGKGAWNALLSTGDREWRRREGVGRRSSRGRRGLGRRRRFGEEGLTVALQDDASWTLLRFFHDFRLMQSQRLARSGETHKRTKPIWLPKGARGELS